MLSRDVFSRNTLIYIILCRSSGGTLIYIICNETGFFPALQGICQTITTLYCLFVIIRARHSSSSVRNLSLT